MRTKFSFIFFSMVLIVILILPVNVHSNNHDITDPYEFYEKGDYSKAYELYIKETYKGDAWAHYMIGTMYLEGKGVPRNYPEAKNYFYVAASGGIELAMRRLGEMFRDGKGVTKSRVLAHMWYSMGAANGDGASHYYRDEVAKDMTPEQIKDSQRMFNNRRKRDNTK